jgi:hypothetical protein
VAPAEAIRILFDTLRADGVAFVPAYVANDLAALRRAYPSDEHFAESVQAVATEILRARRDPGIGASTTHELNGWRRTKATSARIDIRLVFRASKSGIEILAFGDRSFPDSVYFFAAKRTR